MWFGGAAGYRPRVRSAYYARVYVHSPEGHIEHMCDLTGCEGAKMILRAAAVYFLSRSAKTLAANCMEYSANSPNVRSASGISWVSSDVIRAAWWLMILARERAVKVIMFIRGCIASTAPVS